MKKTLRKKTYFLPLTLLLLLSFPTVVSADSAIAENGYTQEGIYYEVHNISYSLYASDSIPVTKEIVYHGKVFPQAELEWVEIIKGSQYSGTLYLVEFTYSSKDNQTTATYEGTLTR